MKRPLVWSLALAALLLAGRPAPAQIVYEFADDTGAAKNSFSVLLGNTLPVRVYIHELTAGAPTLNSQGGLGSGGVRVTFNSPAGVAAVTSLTDVQPADTTIGGPWGFGTPEIGSGANANT